MLFSFLTVHNQSLNPWTGKIICFNENKIIQNEGTFEGYKAYYGTYAHLQNIEKYTAIPFLLFKNNNSNKKPLLLIFNGGPGITNFRLPEGVDTLLTIFDILLPGYQGIDVIQDSTFKIPENNINIIRTIAQDAAGIVKNLNPDTVLVVGHSFGTVYATNFLNEFNTAQHYAIFFSPITLTDITEEINGMSQMLYSYFKNDSCQHLYETLINYLKLSTAQEKTVMGLIYYLSTFENFNNLKTSLQNGINPNPLLLSIYQQQTKNLNKKSQKENLSNCFFIPKNFFNDNENDTFIKQLIFKYFIPLIDNRLQPEKKTIDLPETVITYSGEYDYHIISKEIIPSAAHFDIWKNAYKYIIQTWFEK